ncbi:MAG: helix-turn-helix transcriptional regulator, partial [Vicinamibacterales bacterium]
MKADRLLSVLLLLQAHGKQTGRELATRLEVSERTVHRDMEALSAAGVPVFALRGVGGGWQLDHQWRTQVPGLDEAELRALLMAQPRVIGDARLAAAAERALNKLLAALPLSLRERAASIRQRLYVDTTGWFGTAENLAALPVVQDAVARDRKLAITYRRADREQVDRAVDPLGLVAKGTTWYLVAQTPSGFRTYRVSRIEDATILDVPCERPAGFDLAAHWKASTAQFRDSRQRFDATLRLDPRAADKVRTWRMTSPPEVDSAPDASGWITLRVHFEDEEQARFIVLG